MKALILEDNSSQAHSLKELLSEEGWVGHISYSWNSASAFLKENSIDLLILDILLPDKEGFEVLNILSKEKNLSISKIILISGIANENSVSKKIPKNLKNHCVFFKKPIDEKSFLDFLGTIQISKSDKQETSIFESFFEPNSYSKPSNFYLPQNKTFDSKELIFVVFLAHSKKFTGHLRINTNRNNQSCIDFYKGNIIKMSSNSKKSFFGALLVEHGLCLQKDIKTLLENKESNKMLGEKLVEKNLLSPYMLSVILKEQVKIRLSEIMSHSSFTLDMQKESFENIEAADIDFNETDFIEWLADSLQTEMDKNFFLKLFLEVKATIQKSLAVNKALIHQKFLQDYNKFFKNLNNNSSIEDIINSSMNGDHTLQLLYFGLLTKSIYLKRTKKEVVNIKKIEAFLDNIITKDSKDLFAILDLSWGASSAEARHSYQQLVKTINKWSVNAGENLKEKIQQALYKITESYGILKSEQKRAEYMRVQKEEDFVKIMESYEKGLTKVKSGLYREGIEVLEQIVNYKHTPGNTVLYILWAKLKLNGDSSFENRDKATQMSKAINACPISLRTSPLFWYVKGLFCVKAGQYEKAEELFGKCLKIEKEFLSAKKELILLKSKLTNLKQRNNNKILKFLLKKSS